MRVALAYQRELGSYDFGPAHPLRPERHALAVDLLRSWGILGEHPQEPSDIVMLPAVTAADDDLLLVHSADYVNAVKRASTAPQAAIDHGLGTGDTPAFRGVHEAAALVAGTTAHALESVMAGECRAAFAPAGGLHHAQRDRASGFCVYNDPAIAIAKAVRDQPGLRVAYIDIDAHHGDGVEQAFYERSDVLTVSVHESGRYLFPGTGRATDIGSGAGTGYALNVPLPPYAGARCYELVTESVIMPALSAFAPSVIVAQIGADSHRNDPLTHLSQSVAGFLWVVERLLEAARSLTGGRILLTGGGGYDAFSAVPRMWAGAFCLLARREVPAEVPEQWYRSAREAAERHGASGPVSTGTLDESVSDPDAETQAMALQATEHAVAQARAASPLLARSSA